MVVTKDVLHRLLKGVVDSGRVKTFEQAEEWLRRLKLNVFVGSEVFSSPTLQAALATLLNAGPRTFLGGVNVTGQRDGKLSVPWSSEITLSGICAQWGATMNLPDDKSPSIILGSVNPGDVVGSIKLQVTFDGWVGGVIPEGGKRLPENDESLPVIGVLCAGLGLSEAFLSTWEPNAMIGRRSVLQSLWKPGSTAPGPRIYSLPANVWMVGLGHLGQAALWAMGFVEFADPSEVSLTLQDFDTLAPSNWSTSMLTPKELIGLKKTRWIAQRCDLYGFKTAIVERKFAEGFALGGDDPKLCLLLPDNNSARRALRDCSFDYAIEAGIGSTVLNFTEFVIHTFPGDRDPGNVWRNSIKQSRALDELPEGYRQLTSDGLDECGLLTLVDTAVGAPFVGVVVGCHIVGELLRILNGGTQFQVIQGDLRTVDRMTAIPKTKALKVGNMGIGQRRI